MPASAVRALYERGSYGEDYIQYVYLSVGIIVAAVAVVVRLHLREIADSARANWPLYRCHPAYAPFAGMINPVDGESHLETTAKNFEFCTQGVLTYVTRIALAPVYYAIHAVSAIVRQLMTAINDARAVFARMRNEIGAITLNIIHRIQNIAATLLSDLIVSRNFLNRGKSIFNVGVAVVDTLINTLSSVFGSVLRLILVVLIIMAATIIALWATFLVGWPMAAALTVMMIALMVPFLILEVFGQEVLHKERQNPPGVPHCFPKDTLVRTACGDKSIDELEIGDIMIDGGVVTATMVLTSRDQTLYDIGGTLVTAEHRLEHDGSLVKAKRHPLATAVEDFWEPFVYCVNTSTKKLHIGEMVFVDWDDLDASDMFDLKTECMKRCVDETEFSERSINRHLESGLSSDATVELDDGRTVRINEVRVNDVLRFGETVRGTVVSDATSVESTGTFRLPDGTLLPATSNVAVRDSGCDENNTYDLPYRPMRWDRVYHLVTDTGTFMVNGVKVGDYNSGLEAFLRPFQPPDSPN